MTYLSLSHFFLICTTVEKFPENLVFPLLHTEVAIYFTQFLFDFQNLQIFLKFFSWWVKKEWLLMEFVHPLWWPCRFAVFCQGLLPKASSLHYISNIIFLPVCNTSGFEPYYSMFEGYIIAVTLLVIKSLIIEIISVSWKKGICVAHFMTFMTFSWHFIRLFKKLYYKPSWI